MSWDLDEARLAKITKFYWIFHITVKKNVKNIKKNSILCRKNLTKLIWIASIEFHDLSMTFLLSYLDSYLRRLFIWKGFFLEWVGSGSLLDVAHLIPGQPEMLWEGKLQPLIRKYSSSCCSYSASVALYPWFIRIIGFISVLKGVFFNEP